MKKGRTAAEINFAETAWIRYELAQVKGELMQAQKDVAEVWAENARLTASYQDDADAVCEVLGIEWTKDDEYPAVTLSAIAQLQAELAEAQIDKKLVQQDHLAAAQLGTALADVCAARDALTQERDRLKASRKRLARIAYERGESLAQARAELAAVDEALGKYHIPDTEDHGAYRLQAELTAVKAVARTWFKKAMRRKKELARMHQDAQDWRNEVQELWLSPCEAEGLRGQLAHTQRQLAAASEAAEWLWGFYDGNTLIAKPGYEDEISEAWGKLLIAADSTPSALQLQERLTTLDAAEAALADCGIGGIFAEFDGLPDAIEQMAQHIKELTQEPVEVEMTDAEMGEALRTEVRKRVTVGADAHALSKALDACTQTIHTERQLRREAEQYANGMKFGRDNWRTAWENVTAELAKTRKQLIEAEQELKQRQQQIDLLCGAELRAHQAGQRTENLQQEKVGVHGALDECRVPRGYDDGKPASSRTCILWLNRRAERAEALAALVTPELAVLLERLSESWIGKLDDKEDARALAARIREALGEDNEG